MEEEKQIEIVDRMEPEEEKIDLADKMEPEEEKPLIFPD